MSQFDAQLAFLDKTLFTTPETHPPFDLKQSIIMTKRRHIRPEAGIAPRHGEDDGIIPIDDRVSCIRIDALLRRRIVMQKSVAIHVIFADIQYYRRFRS